MSESVRFGKQAVMQVKAMPLSRQGMQPSQQLSKERVAFTLRLPLDLELELRRWALMKGDLTKIVSFALEHTDVDKLDILASREIGFILGKPITLHLGSSVRAKLRSWAIKKRSSMNSVVYSALSSLFKRVERNPALRTELLALLQVGISQ